MGSPRSRDIASPISRAGLKPRRRSVQGWAGTGTTTGSPSASCVSRTTHATCLPKSRSRPKSPSNFARRRNRRAQASYTTAATTASSAGASERQAAHRPRAGPRRSVPCGSGDAQPRQTGGRSGRSAAQHAGQAPRRCTEPRSSPHERQRVGRKKPSAGATPRRCTARATRGQEVMDSGTGRASRDRTESGARGVHGR